METLTVYGTSWCGDCICSRSLLDRRGVEYRWVDIDEDREADVTVRHLNRGNRSVPTLVFPDGSILVEPSDRQLTEHLDQRGL